MPPTDAALLTGFRLRNAEQRLGVHGVHVHREGHPPVEHRFRADDTVEVYSASKTLSPSRSASPGRRVCSAWTTPSSSSSRARRTPTVRRR